jgi:branched-chain amino acid transport system permease protein
VALFLQRLFDALGNGAIYAAMAVALAIVHRATGHINFAQGEMATVATFVVYVLAAEQGLPIGVAIAVAVVGAFAAGASVERTLVRPLERRNPNTVVIVTIGLFLVINSVAQLVWLGPPRSFPSPLPDSAEAVTVAGARLRWATVWSWVVLGAVLVALRTLLTRTRTGLAFRAVAANRESAALVGIDVGRTFMVGWGLAAALGTLAGVLHASTSPTFDTNLMVPVLLYGFAAATLGGFDSPGGALVGGVAVAFIETMSAGYLSVVGSELAQAGALVTIIVVLLVRPNGLFGTARVRRA